MTDDELNEQLRRLGRREPPPVDGAFANRLEADLRAVHTRSGRGFALPDVLLRPAAVIAALVVVLGVVAVVQRSGDQPGVAMVAADGTTVSIPGGESFEPGRAGLDLPEGTRIEVAEGGAAIVAGVVLEAGSTAIVVDGRLEVLESPAVTATDPPVTSVAPTSSTAPQTSAAPRTTTEATDAPEPTDSVSPTSSGEPPRTTVPVTTAPLTTDPDVAPTTTSTTTDPEVAPTTTSTTTDRVDGTDGTTSTRPPVSSTTGPSPTVATGETAISLAIGPVRRSAATLTWRVDGPTDAIAGWEVRIVREGTVKTIAFIRVADARRIRVEVPDSRVAYRVIARSGGDGVVARSALVSPGG